LIHQNKYYLTKNLNNTNGIGLPFESTQLTFACHQQSNKAVNLNPIAVVIPFAVRALQRWRNGI